MEALHSEPIFTTESASLTHVGNVRSTNEDSVYAHTTPPCYAVVADGMGGHAAGEVASGIAVAAIREQLDGAQSPLDADQIVDAVQYANKRILDAIEENPTYKGMGTTLTLAYMEPRIVTVAHVGDSCAYLLHGGKLVKITRDHTYVQKLIDIGVLHGDPAEFPYRNVITRALGMPRLQVDMYRTLWEPGDRILLCSDGLTAYADADRMLAELSRETTVEEQAASLLKYALEEGGRDNISVIIASNPVAGRHG